jgi:hypothetical protein
VRYLLILLLGVAVVWLLVERNGLMTDVAKLQADVATNEKRAQEAEQKLAAITGPRQPGSPSVLGGTGTRGTWLDEHIQRGAKALEVPSNPEKNRR